MLGRASMVGTCALAATLATAGCSASSRTTARSRMTTKEIVVKFKPGIVRVMSPVGIGTGFIVAGDGRIVTNLHVIQGADWLKVVLADDTELSVDKVVAVDPAHDLAIISVASGRELPVLTLGNSDQVETGDRVIAIGNPLGVLDYTVSDGLISSVRSHNGLTVLQISAPISVGSSGGPLFNTYGEVIGIATFIAEKGQNLNFGMPSNYIKPMLEKSGGISVAEFAAKTNSDFASRLANPNAPPPDPSQGNPAQIQREVPKHAMSILSGCTEDVLVEIYQEIGRAISIGAPVYNAGEHGACYDIYRRSLERFESDKRVCKGVREAIGHGLLRANAIDEKNPTSRAWALRDTFDGLLNVIGRKASGEK